MKSSDPFEPYLYALLQRIENNLHSRNSLVTLFKCDSSGCFVEYPRGSPKTPLWLVAAQPFFPSCESSELFSLLLSGHFFCLVLWSFTLQTHSLIFSRLKRISQQTQSALFLCSSPPFWNCDPQLLTSASLISGLCLLYLAKLTGCTCDFQMEFAPKRKSRVVLRLTLFIFFSQESQFCTAYFPVS